MPPQAPGQPYGQPYGQPSQPYGQPPQPGQPPYGQQPGYQPGGYGAPPPKKSGKVWLFSLLGVGLLLILCCGGVGYGVYKAVNSGGADSPTDAVNTFLDAVKAQDSEAAKEVTCNAEKDEVNVTDLGSSGSTPESEQVREALKKVTWTISDDKRVNGDKHEVTAQLTVPIAGQTTPPFPLTFIVVKEGGWKVCDTKK